MFQRLLVCLLTGFLAATTVLATPSVSVQRVQQRYPWNGLVDIDYTISGMEASDDPCAYTVSFPIAATVSGVARTVVPVHFLSYAPCDLPVTNGSYRVTWDSAADGADAHFLAKGASVKAVLDRSSATKANADFALVYVSEGSSAASWPVRFVAAPDLPTTVFNCDRYKKDVLVFKRVTAGVDFRMGTGTSDDVSTGKNWFLCHLTDDYFLGLFPVTGAQHYRLTGGSASTSVQMVKVSWSKLVGSTGPLTNLCAKALAGSTSVTGFSLPTEAQWEYAARAGSQKARGGVSLADWPDYSWGEANAGASANHDLGLKKPNGWGFYDLFGPTSESCLDHYADYPANSSTVVYTNYANVSWALTGNIVQRGGHFAATPACGRRESRGASTGDTNYSRYLGYRLVLNP